MHEAILFDLDGTLIDSIELIIRSYEHTLREHGKPAASRDQILGYIGIPLRTHLVAYASSEAEVQEMMVTYRAWNHLHHDEFVRPFPGVDSMLASLKAQNTTIAVVTSKLSDAAWRGLSHCKLEHFFDVLIGADDVDKHKPDPTPLLVACSRLGVEPTRSVYVGDSVHDMAAACAAEMGAIGAGWGPFDAEALTVAGAQCVLDSPEDVAGILR
ncbi:MAG: HAD-IA family hydrolase [Planctomycetes bacterium]|nr:HAD-IA family hydrolase [Planctomycetota bacterium]MCB9919105.1 HAD-IA family hydrolase [Planctomycetota bacterium]